MATRRLPVQKACKAKAARGTKLNALEHFILLYEPGYFRSQWRADLIEAMEVYARGAIARAEGTVTDG